MSTGKKWLTNVRADEPLTEVVRSAIQDRLEVVLSRLSLATKHPNEDVEHVHQLRVATRRAQSALQLFSDALPLRRSRWLNRYLKQLRKAAGRARDLDVLIARLETQREQTGRGTLAGIVADLKRQRRQAQRPLRAAWKDCRCANVHRKLRQFVERIRWRGEAAEPEFCAAAPRRLVPLAEDFFAAGEVDLNDPQNLHPMRIAGKKLRYAMELLSGAFDSQLRESLYPQFLQIQEELGEINDYLVAKSLFDQWLIQSDDRAIDLELTHLIVQEEQALINATERFRVEWTTDVAVQMQTQFIRLLNVPRRQPRKKKPAKLVKRKLCRA